MEARRERRYGWSRCAKKPTEVAMFQRTGALVLEMPGSAQAACCWWKRVEEELQGFLTDTLIIW